MTSEPTVLNVKKCEQNILNIEARLHATRRTKTKRKIKKQMKEAQLSLDCARQTYAILNTMIPEQTNVALDSESKNMSLIDDQSKHYNEINLVFSPTDNKQIEILENKIYELNKQYQEINNIVYNLEKKSEIVRMK